MLPIQKQISKFNHSDGNTREFIVIHDTGNYIDDDEGNSHYFNEGDRQSSAHYFVDEDSITQIVEDSQASWHCGDGNMKYGIGNHNSIGIEMCNDFGIILDETLKNTLDLVRFLMNKYNIPIDKVVRHYDASRKVCPHNLSSNNWEAWAMFKSRLMPVKISSVNERSNFNMFNEAYYLKTNLDVAKAVSLKQMTALEHYNTYGKKEGRRPTPQLPLDFVEGAYLNNNLDVKEAVNSKSFTCGAEHWLIYGWNENRKYTK